MIGYEEFIEKAEKSNWFNLGNDEVKSDIVKRYEVWIDENEEMYICQILKGEIVIISKVIN